MARKLVEAPLLVAKKRALIELPALVKDQKPEQEALVPVIAQNINALKEQIEAVRRQLSRKQEQLSHDLSALKQEIEGKLFGLRQTIPQTLDLKEEYSNELSALRNRILDNLSALEKQESADVADLQKRIEAISVRLSDVVDIDKIGIFAKETSSLTDEVKKLKTDVQKIASEIDGFSEELKKRTRIRYVSTASTGDMTKAIYDPDADGIIAKAQLDTSVLANPVSEITFTPKASSTGAEGTIFYCSDDDHVYVGTE